MSCICKVGKWCLMGFNFVSQFKANVAKALKAREAQKNNSIVNVAYYF